MIPGRILSTLIDYNFIINTDLGLLKLIREQFQDPRAFILDTVNKSDIELLRLLCTRTNINPLSVISTEENMKDIDKLYLSFFDTYRDEIVKKSIIDNSTKKFLGLMLNVEASTGIKTSIGANDEYEKEDGKKHFKVIPVENYNMDLATSFSIFYIRDYTFIEKYKLQNVKDKKFYINPLKCNITYLLDHKEFCNNNIISIAGTDYGNIFKGEKING
jgi:hypothetical protein